MTAKTERIAIRVSKATKSKLERMAKEENRSMSNYIENIIIQNLEEKEMTNLIGKKVKDLTAEEREYLENNISGDYRGLSNELEKGENFITIDFVNGLSVAGILHNNEDEIYYELDEEATIYDPKDM